MPPSIVEKFHHQLIETALSLNQFPTKGQVELLLNDGKNEYRRLIVNHVKIIYRIGPDYILVTDFFDSRQDPRKMR